MALSLANPAPGFAASFRERLGGLAARAPHELPSRDVPGSFHRAAVLLPFWREGDRVRLLLTERSSELRSHAGQVVFPGGRIDAGDASEEAAALRETWEEVGIAPDSVRVLGRLDDSWSGARHHVAAFVGWLDAPPELVLSPDEVAAAMIADVEPLLDPNAAVATEHEYMGQHYVDYSFSGDWGKVVGMTADLLLEVLQFVRGERAERGRARLAELRRYVATHPDFDEA